MSRPLTRALLHLLLAIGVFAAAQLAAQTAPAAAQPAPQAAEQPAAPEAATTRRLRQIVVVEGVEPGQQPAPAPGFLVLAPAFASFDAAELTKRLAEGENQVMEPKLLTAIGQVIENYARQQNYPHAMTTIPTQNIAEGKLTVVLLLHPPLIRRIVVGASEEEAQQLAASSANDYIVLSPAFAHLPRTDLATRLATGENQPFQERLVAAIAQVIEVFFKQHDFLAASAVIPPQNASDGILRVVVHLGKIRNIKVAGNRWFSESLLREKLRIEQGETLRMSELDRAISWTNNNPFRRVRVQVDPVANTGEADLVVAVQDSLPLRTQLSYDSGGNAIIGRDRFTAAVSYANLWGRDHQISYQLITTDLGFKVYQGHGLDYRVPLPWQDSLQVSALYLTLAPSIIAGYLDQEGKNINASVRYSHPLRSTDMPGELYAGLEFKQSNNNLLFYVDDTTRIPAVTNQTDVFQFTTGGSMIRRDKHGAWAFGANLNFSPGRVNSRNSEAAFHSSRPFSNPRYAYGQVTFQRLVNLSYGWDFMSRGVGQYSHHNLLSSEELYVGGGSSVRGYRENVFGGDSGYFLSNELISPAIKRRVGRLQQTLDTRFVGFFDTARVRVHLLTNLDPPVSSLASAGVGVRMNVGTNFSLTADYGWQLTYLPYKVDKPRRGHLKATLAF